MFKASPRIVTVILANLFITLLLAEGTGVVIGYLKLRMTYFNSHQVRKTVAETLPQSVFRNDEAKQKNGTRNVNSARRLHPYFGITYDPDKALRTNNFGFSESVDFPYSAKPGEFVVGVFGGSFAQDIRKRIPRKELIQGILPLVRGKGYTSVRMLNFAIGGHRMPQTLFTFYYYFDMIDMAVFLDGFNEYFGLPLESELSGYRQSFDFPMGPNWKLLSATSITDDTRLLQLKVAEIRDRQWSWLDIAGKIPFRYSMLCQTFWKVYNNFLEQEARQFLNRIVALREVPKRYGFIDRLGQSDEAILKHYFNKYGARLAYAARTCRDNSKPFFHFIQPNQYVTGSKRYSPEEEKIALSERNNPRLKKTDAMYNHLKWVSKNLRFQGIFSSYSLVMHFSDNAETLYRDSCCHMNEKGMGLVAEAIIESIQDDPQLTRIPVAGQR